MNEYRIPKFLHRPYQVLFLDSEDLGVIFFFFMVNMLFDLGKLGWIASILAVYFLLKLKRNGPRGYVKHLGYHIGLVKFKMAPGRFETKFYE
ncbi:MAG: type IV conjugative transfer system protein TraL [Nanopusillaceae archaeon]